MGLFLNTLSPKVLYEEIVKSTYFVDKTDFISQVAERIGTSNKYLCITRPRRFGKTVMANMLGAFFTKAGDSRHIFSSLSISKNTQAMQQLNHYNVIYIDFSRVSADTTSYTSYIENIIDILKNDLQKAYPQVDYREGSGVAEDLERIMAAKLTRKFKRLNQALEHRIAPVKNSLSYLNGAFRNTCPHRTVVIHGMRQLHPLILIRF